MTSSPGRPSNGDAPEAVLRTVSGRDVGFDPDGLARVDEVVRGALDIVFPAAALLVARRRGVVLHGAYGYLDPERRQRPTRTDSLFDLASVTKLFSATAFMTLVEGGQVSLDTPVAHVLPEFGGVRPIGPTEDPVTKRSLPPDPAFAGREIDARQVTFWHLLTHTSGLAAWGSLYREEGSEDASVPVPHQVSPERRGRRIAAIHRRYGFAYPPGERLVYSDLGLILLGEAAARLSGMPLDARVRLPFDARVRLPLDARVRLPLDAFVRRAVLDPLGLTHTTYNPLAHGISPDRLVPTEFCAWRKRRCLGEVHDENAAGLGGVAAHAGLFSTAWEVAALGQTYLNGGSYGGVRVLSPGTVAEMTRVHVDLDDNPRGLGWLQRSRQGSSSGRWFGPRSYGHTGYTGTSLWVDPDRALVVALLTNRVYGGRDPAGIAAFRPRLHDAVIEAMR